MEKAQSSIIDLLFTIALFAVFSISAVGAVVMGAGVYKSTVSNMKSNFSMRTAVSYITEKVHQADSENSLQLIEINGIDVLKLKQTEGEAAFATYIYCMDGYISELFLPFDSKCDLSQGEKLTELQSLEISTEDNGVFYFELTDAEGKVQGVYLRPRTEQGGGVS